MPTHKLLILVASLFYFAGVPQQAVQGAPEDSTWIHLIDKELSAWQGDTDNWIRAGDAAINDENPRQLTAAEGTHLTVIADRKIGNLVTKSTWGDLEVHMEFMIPERSNSGVKLQGLYEVQIRDSHTANPATANDCGGVYPRAEMKPRYHHIDKGIPPRLNAAKPAGQWQTLEIRFRAPRFESDGNKTENACFEKVVLNGQTIHEDVELRWPTGHAWNTQHEVARGPLFLQADHGSIAFRNVRVRELPERQESGE